MPAWMMGVGRALSGAGQDLRSWDEMRRQEEERAMQMRLQGIFPAGEEPLRPEEYRHYTGPGLATPQIPQAPESPAELARAAAASRGPDMSMAERARATLSPGVPQIPESFGPPAPTSRQAQAPVRASVGTGGQPIAPRDLAAGAVGLRPDFETRTREAPYDTRIPMGSVRGQDMTYVPGASAAGIQAAQAHERARDVARESDERRTASQMAVAERTAELGAEQTAADHERSNRAGYALGLAEGFVEGEYDPAQDYTNITDQLNAALTREGHQAQVTAAGIRADRPQTPDTFEEFLDQMAPVYMRAYQGVMGQDPQAASDAVFTTVAEQWLLLHPDDARVSAMFAVSEAGPVETPENEERRGFVEWIKGLFGGPLAPEGDAGAAPAEAGGEARSADQWLQYFESIGVPRRKQSEELRKRAAQGLVTDAENIAG